MGGGSPAPVVIPAPPTPPAINPADTALQMQAGTDEARIAAMGGRASTILTSPNGVLAMDPGEKIATKALLGN